MSELDFKEYQPFLLIVAGFVLVAIALLKKATTSHLKQSGLKTVGTIFALERKSNNTSTIGDNLNIKDKVTVRFVTQNKEWITGDITQEFAAFFTGQYKEGQNVDVYYDPKNPNELHVDTKQSETMSRVIFAVVGLCFGLIGFYQLLA